MTLAVEAAIREAKDYVQTVVGALVDNAPKRSIR